jgi:chromosomal replication initiation ATPase DnaA
MNLRETKKELDKHGQLLTSMGTYINELEGFLKKQGYKDERILQLRTKHSLESKNNQYMQIANGHSLTFEMIMSIVSSYYQSEPEKIRGKLRFRSLVTPRHMFCYLVKQYIPNSSLKEIGTYLSGRHHTSVLHGRQTIQTFLGFDKQIQRDYSNIIDLMNEHETLD